MPTVATLLVTDVPLSYPSLGVRVHCSTSPRLNALIGKVWVVTPIVLLLTVHAAVYDTVCPSASNTLPGVQDTVSAFVGVVGEMYTLESTGGVFLTVTVLDNTSVP